MDFYKAKLAEEAEVLQNCQKQHRVKSCMLCKEVIGCATRKSYVNAVYQSMNKGKGGGFEF
ncbi:MAG: hypothetical protein DSZ05_07915 [Sulfurospirillum sp.]|nr:MAG: hypothetical protein DSZ05_07915 [Sulfurospirillum sp.]